MKRAIMPRTMTCAELIERDADVLSLPEIKPAPDGHPCPECDGSGRVDGWRSPSGHWNDPDCVDGVEKCPDCKGVGVYEDCQHCDAAPVRWSACGYEHQPSGRRDVAMGVCGPACAIAVLGDAGHLPDDVTDALVWAVLTQQVSP
jgi:hypothetical protein